MIYQDIQITVNQGLAVPDKSLYIFRGDSNIILNFKLVTPQYMLTKDNKDNLVTRFGVDNFELRLQLEKGYDRIIRGVITEDGCCRTQLTQNAIQELRIGTYSYQITLIDDDANAIMTFPVCKAKLTILDRMSLTAEELAVPGGLSGEAMADLSIVVKIENKIEAFDSNGNYIKTEWSAGDIISSAKLNKIEEAIDKINQNEINDKNALNAQLTRDINTLENKKADKEDIARISNGTPLFANSINEMTNTSRNYVNINDGCLYIYNGNSFVNSNVKYQSTGINNGSVTHRKLNDELNSLFVPYYSSQHDFEWIENCAIKYDGATVEHSGYKYCKYPVTETEVYKIKNQRMFTYASWLVVDNNNNVLLTDKIADDMSMVPVEDEIEIPAGGMFLYFNSYNNSFEYLLKTKYELKPSEVEFEYLPKEIKDNFEEVFNDVTESMNWIAGSYIMSDGTFINSDIHAYSVIDVKEGLEIKITGKHSWNISCFVVKDDLDLVILEDGGKKGEVTSFNDFTFEIPVRGTKLYVNQYGFEKLEIKNKLRMIQNVKSPLENKTILFTGDSICAAAIEVSPGVYNGQYGWAEIIQENNPLATVKNYGVGGSTVALQENTSKNILTRIDTMYNDYPDADYIILEGGVNDSYSSSISLGEISEGYNAVLDEQTFCGALESLFKKCILKWKGKKIGYIVTFKVPTADACDFESYMLKAKQICEKWSIPYIDLYTQSGLEYHIDEIKELYSYGGGGLHPNIEGYNIITPKIENWIKSL